MEKKFESYLLRLVRTNFQELISSNLISCQKKEGRRKFSWIFRGRKGTAQCSKVSRCGARKDVAGTRIRLVRHGRYILHTAQTKGFTVRTLCLPHETPPQTPCPEGRMSRAEKLPGRIYERRQIGVQFFSFNRERVKTVVYSSLRATLPRFKRH